MNIYVESNGKVHFDGDDNDTLHLYTEDKVTMWGMGAPVLKSDGGLFDDVEAFS